jgi:hypothetical protein
MATEAIIRKLSEEITEGITTEAEVVYVLAGIRKLIERDDLGETYPSLDFHCDWAFHSELDRKPAKRILAEFDAAQPLLAAGAELHEVDNSIQQISGMRNFHWDFQSFSDRYGLPPLRSWSHFIHLYTRVIEDIPLLVKPNSPDAARHISKITVHYEAGKETLKVTDKEHFFYKVIWRIFDKNGDSGEIFVINSYEVN